MAKKRKTDKPTQKDFHNNPFKSLKGLSVSGPEEPKKSPVQTASPPEPAAEEAASFEDEMAGMGVKQLFADKEAVEAPLKEGKHVPRKPVAEREQDEFLNAVGRLDKRFKDEWAEEDEMSHARPRRMKQVEKGQLKPEAELDLHGMTRDEAAHRMPLFLQNAVHHGMRTVLIITGKGYHSEDGPVLRQAVEKQLNDLQKLVVEWGQAPRRYGGSGALVVFLRKNAPGQGGQ